MVSAAEHLELYKIEIGMIWSYCRDSNYFYTLGIKHVVFGLCPADLHLSQ